MKAPMSADSTDSIARAMAYEAAERVRFEAWLQAKTTLRRTRDLAGYTSGITHTVWLAWLERALLTDAAGVTASDARPDVTEAPSTDANETVSAIYRALSRGNNLEAQRLASHCLDAKHAAARVQGRALPPMPWAADPVPDDCIPLAQPRTAARLNDQGGPR